MSFNQINNDFRIPLVSPVGSGGFGIDSFNYYSYHDGKRVVIIPKMTQEEGWVSPSGATAGALINRNLFNSNIGLTTGTNANVPTTKSIDVQYTTTATNGSLAVLYNNSTLPIRSDHKPLVFFRFKLLSLTVLRFFVGLTDSTTSTTMSTSDSPAFGYIGLQFSTARGDTKFQFSRRTNSGGSQTLVDTGITPSITEFYTLVMDHDGTNVILSLLDQNMATLWGSGSISSNLIPATTGSGFRILLETLENVSKTWGIYSNNGFVSRIF